MPRKVNAFQRKDGRWEIQMYVGKRENGRRVYKSLYGLTKEEAEAKYDYEMNLREKIRSENMTIAQLADMWLESKKESDIKEVTYLTYVSQANIVKEFFGEKKVMEITHEDLENFKKSLSFSYTDNYVTRYIAVFNAIINNADWIPKINNSAPALSKKQETLLNKSEIKYLRDFCIGNLDAFSCVFYIMLCTGVKVGEICALKWADIDLANNEIVVNKTMNRVKSNFGDGSMGTRVITSMIPVRRVPMMDSLRVVLKLKQANGYITTGDTVYMEPRVFQNQLKSFLKKCGIDKTITATTIRDSIIINAIENGVNLKFIADVMGVTVIHLEKTYFKYVTWKNINKSMINEM